MTGPASADEVCAVALRQPRTSLITLVVKTIEIGSQPSPIKPVGRTAAIHAGKLVVQRRTGQASDGGRSHHRWETGKEPVPARLKRRRRANPQADRTEHTGWACGPWTTPLSSLISGWD